MTAASPERGAGPDVSGERRGAGRGENEKSVVTGLLTTSDTRGYQGTPGDTKNTGRLGTLYPKNENIL